MKLLGLKGLRSWEVLLMTALWAGRFVGQSDAKVIAAFIQTDLRQFSDIYLGSFTFDALGGRVKIHSQSGVRGQRFLFFDGSVESWPTVLATYSDLSCLGLRNSSLMVTEDSESNSLSEGLSVPFGRYQADLQLSPSKDPAVWYTMLSNCEDVIDLDFKLTFLNPGGWWFEQFSVDEQGILALFIAWAVAYTISLPLYVYMKLKMLGDTQAKHPTLYLLDAAVGLHYIGILLQALHGYQYASDGEGLKALQGLAEVIESASNLIIMVLLLVMARGWAITTANGPMVFSKEWMTGAGIFMCGFFSLFVIERVGRAIDERYCYDTDIGILSLVLRTAVYIYFFISLVRSIRMEEQEHRKQFLAYFGLAASAWFLALPAAYCVSQFLSPWNQMKSLS